NRHALVDGTPGVEIYPELAPAVGEHVIKKHRYSGFFGTDLDIILREWGVDTVIISGTTTENCCQSTARDAMFRNYRVVFLSDATATYDYPDRGFGAMPAADVHHAMLVILEASTAHLIPFVIDFHAVRPVCHPAPPKWLRSFRLKRSHFDRKPVLYIGLEQSLIGFVDFLDRNDFDIGGDVVSAAKVEHLLRFRDAANHRAGETAPPADEVECGDAQRLCGSAHKCEIATDAE